ncbi:MAG: preprotein translocase subunit YajC [Clostridiales bacterium]|nr:preprotein translocase subunit YajC [Clostridiales bacterium]
MNFLPLFLSADATAADAASGTSQLIVTGVMVVGLVAIMYFAVIRPQKKREKALKEQMGKLRVGDSVVTIGGIVGRVANIKEDEITISTSLANTLITFQKSAISTVVKPEEEKKETSAVDKAKAKKKKFKLKDEEDEE